MPSGSSSDPVIQACYGQESQHAMDQWRKHFRGDVRVVRDDEFNDL